MSRQLIIDSNMIEDPALERFLAADPRHRAVVAFEIWFELYKQRSLAGLLRGLEIMGRFPDQLLVLRASGEIMRLDPWAPDLLGRMEIQGSGHSVREMVAALSPATDMNPAAHADLLAKWDWAADLNLAMLEGAQDILTSLPEMQEQLFDTAEIGLLRKGGEPSRDMYHIVFAATDQLWQEFCRMRNMDWRIWADRRGGTLLYRVSLGILVYLLWWISKGSQSRKKLEATRNDVIDLLLAAQATYFDGFLTQDQKAADIHARLRDALARFYSWDA